MTVPQGTVDEVLDWVGDDPARAEEALEHEYAGHNRSTLISKLEAIASREEDTMTESTATTNEPEDLGPVPPADLELDAADVGVTVQPVALRDPDVEFDLDGDLTPTAEELEDDKPLPIDAEQAESVQVASGTRGLILSVNGVPYAFTAQLAAALKGQVDEAVSGLNL